MVSGLPSSEFRYTEIETTLILTPSFDHALRRVRDRSWRGTLSVR